MFIIRKIMTHIPWNHYNNIHSLLAKSDKIIHSDGFFTEKLDGSNLGIHIKKINDEWKLVAVYGRKTIISQEEIKIIKYGNAGSLGDLPNKMYEYAQKIANKLMLDEIIIYGESYRQKKAQQKFASWHPFGYRNNADKEIINLSPKIYDLFCDTSEFCLSMKDIKCPDEYRLFLENSQSHVIYPPLVLYNGKISDGIKYLEQLMMKSHKEFEGVFVSSSDGCFKWKTSKYEEQQKFKKNKNTSQEIEDILYKVFHNDTPNQPEKSLETMIENAYIHESRINEIFNIKSVEDISTEEKKNILTTCINLVISELKSQFTDNNEKIPWSDDIIEAKCKKIIYIKLFKQ